MKTKTHLNPGNKINRLTVIKLSHIGKHYRSYYVFKCDCGTEKVLLGSGVVSGNTKSCGCLSREVKRAKRLPDNRGVINHLILQYKRHARNRGFAFRLSYKVFSERIRSKCFYCGDIPNNIKITKSCKEGFLYNGIDRVDTKKGYTSDNTVPCCSICNRAKSNLTLEVFKNWAKRLNAMAEQWGGNNEPI